MKKAPRNKKSDKNLKTYIVSESVSQVIVTHYEVLAASPEEALEKYRGLGSDRGQYVGGDDDIGARVLGEQI